MISVYTIGETAIDVDDRPIRADAEILFATLLYLAVERGRRVDREALCSLLWPREAVPKRRHSLRQVVYKLRRLGVLTQADASALILPVEKVWLDFEDAVEARGAPADRTRTSGTSARGLPGYAPRFSKQYQAWVEAIRGRVESAARRRLAAEIAQSRTAGAWDRVESLARKCLEIDPLNEEATLALAEATALAGGKSAAVAILDRYVKEVGISAYQVKLPASVLRRRITERFSAPATRGWLEAKLVGRDEVVARISAALEETKQGQATTHVVWGPQGIGKSRVLEEAGRIAALLGSDVVAERANPNDVHTPGLTLVRVFQAMLNKPGAIGLQPPVLEYLQQLTAHTGATFGTSSENDEDSLTRALVDLQRSLAWESPIVATLDDAHHADALTLRILSRARGCLGNERILWILSSQVETTIRCEPDRAHQLRRLDHAASVQLASAFLSKAGADASAETLERIATASGGLPLLLREAAAAFVGDPSAAATRSIEALLDRRFATLSPVARDLLLGALLLGEHATVSLVLQASSASADDGERGLGELEEEQILRFREGGAIEAHGAWLGGLGKLYPPGKVAARRLRVAEVLERSSQGKRNAAELLLSSAIQLQHAGERGRAADLFVRSAEGLEARSLPLAASATFSRAARLADTSAEFDNRMFQALVAASHAQLTEETREVLERFGARLASSPSLSPHDRAEATLLSLELQQQVGFSDTASVRQCLKLVRFDDFTSHERLRAALLAVRTAEFNYDRDLVSAVVAASRKVDTTNVNDEALRDQIAIVDALAHSRLAEARTLAERDLKRARNQPAMSQRCRALMNARVAFWFDCDFDRVGAIVDEARDALHAYPTTHLAARVEDAYAAFCVETMRLDEAERSLTAAVALAKRVEDSPQPRFVNETRCRLRAALGLTATDLDVAHLTAQTETDAPLTRARVFELSTATVLLARNRDDGTAIAVHALEQAWSRIRAFCPFDYPCAALAVGLASLGLTREASAVWGTYSTSLRVATRPPAPFVASILREFAI